MNDHLCSVERNRIVAAAGGIGTPLGEVPPDRRETEAIEEEKRRRIEKEERRRREEEKKKSENSRQ